jgi:hypothetical protein
MMSLIRRSLLGFSGDERCVFRDEYLTDLSRRAADAYVFVGTGDAIRRKGFIPSFEEAIVPR